MELELAWWVWAIVYAAMLKRILLVMGLLLTLQGLAWFVR